VYDVVEGVEPTEGESIELLLLGRSRNMPAAANNMSSTIPIIIFLRKNRLLLIAQQFLYFFPLPQGQRVLRPIFIICRVANYEEKA
jgi:hypothetical protein